MIAQVGRKNAVSGRQVAAGRLPVPRGAEHAVQHDERRMPLPAKLPMEQWYDHAS